MAGNQFEIWVTADWHLGHENILKLCNRPFKDVVAMDVELVRRWNARVRPADAVFVLGDVALKVSPTYVLSVLRSLNGTKHLVAGNHDEPWLRRWEGWKAVSDISILKTYKTTFTMCHYPMESWKGQRGRGVHLHGHSHGRARVMRNRFDVGVDCWNFVPVRLRDLAHAAKMLG